MKRRALVFPLLVLYPLYAGVMFGTQQEILFPASSDKHYSLAVRLPSTGRLVEISSDCHFDHGVFSARLPAWFAENGILDPAEG